MDSELRGLPAIAAYLGVCAKTAGRLAEQRAIPVFRIGRQWRMRVGSYEEQVRELERGGGEPVLVPAGDGKFTVYRAVTLGPAMSQEEAERLLGQDIAA